MLTCFVLSCSSEATRSRAKKLADEIGSWHLDVHIDSVISALLSLFQTLTGKRPCYKVNTHLIFLLSITNLRRKYGDECGEFELQNIQLDLHH